VPGETTAERQARETIRRFREITANAVSFVRSQEVNRSFASISLEELVDNQIALIEDGRPSAGRPSKLARVDRIKEDLDRNIDAIKEVDPDLFRRPDSRADVNTERETEDT
tara:strand:- start:249 stop:581 length:333 start_codon:yes stop_codon:yes gene_type:complete